MFKVLSESNSQLNMYTLLGFFVLPLPLMSSYERVSAAAPHWILQSLYVHLFELRDALLNSELRLKLLQDPEP